MANVLKHRFSSAKADGPDLTQVQPSNWNDGHAFTGGVAGDVLTRDPTDATYGAKWVTPAPVAPPVTAIVYDGTGTPYIVLPPGSAALVDVTALSATRITIHGITVNADTKVGTRATIRVQGVGDILLAYNSPSAPANGAFLNWVTSGPTPLACGNLLDGTTSGGGSGASATYVFDGARWRLVAHEQGRPLKVPYNAGSFIGCTIPGPANANPYDYYIHGTDAHVRVFLVGATLPAPVASIVVAGWPFTFIPGSTVPVPTITSIGGYGFCFSRVSADLAGIKFEKTDFSNWAPGTFDFAFDLTVPIR